jgi:hypothetical protein
MDEATLVIIALLVVAAVIAWWLAITDLSRRRDLTGWHLAASYLVILLPLLGAAAYYVFRPLQGATPRVADAYAAEQIAVVAALRRNGVITREEYERECAAVLQISAATRRA